MGGAVIDLNLTGTFLVTQCVFKATMSKEGGSVCSILADMWNGIPYMAHRGRSDGCGEHDPNACR